MPNWNEVFKEIVVLASSGDTLAIDTVRQKYLKELHTYTGRNVIAYYSGWLQKPGIEGSLISDDDKNGLMMAVHNMDCSKGLDIFLHTPGGDILATESFIDYLHRKFRNSKGQVDIRIIVPQLAMSAGTMIACSGTSILIGRQSSLGPIDPQLRGLPAHGVIEEFKQAHSEIAADPSKLSVWQFILQKYHPTFLTECQNAISLSEEFVHDNLKNVMFASEKNPSEKASLVVDYLTAYKDRKSHSRHINIDECKRIGLVIEELEADQKLQDLVLTIHHCYMHTLSNSPVIKVIENHIGAVKAQLIS